MRSLIIRFEDCEGPGIIESILREKGYGITYHDAYRRDLTLMPGTSQVFDVFVFMGGSSSVYEPNLSDFFETYLQLIREILNFERKKILGICLGSQLLAKAMGGIVKIGENGGEIGFGTVEVIDSSNRLFQNITDSKLPTLHFHRDIFTLPPGTTPLLSSEKYDLQMFSNNRNAYGILPHFEVTESMYQVWKNRFPEFKSAVISEINISEKIEKINSIGKTLIRNLLSIS